MRRRRRRETGSDPRQQALHLIELALDDATTVEERRSAAMRAVKHIDKYDLLTRPFEGNETVQAAMNVAETITDSDLVGNLKKLVGQIGQARRRR
jgi:hypothetical protein